MTKKTDDSACKNKIKEADGRRVPIFEHVNARLNESFFVQFFYLLFTINK